MIFAVVESRLLSELASPLVGYTFQNLPKYFSATTVLQRSRQQMKSWHSIGKVNSRHRLCHHLGLSGFQERDRIAKHSNNFGNWSSPILKSIPYMSRNTSSTENSRESCKSCNIL